MIALIGCAAAAEEESDTLRGVVVYFLKFLACLVLRNCFLELEGNA